MKAFPTDDLTLDALEHALGATRVFDPPDEDDGEPIPRIEGADYSLSQLLDFMSGYDKTRSMPTADPSIYEYDGSIYSTEDVIAALVREVRRCREPM